MSELFLKIVNMSISASWLVLAVLLLRLVMKKAPKWVSVLLWGLVAVRLICPFSFESALSLIPSAETVSPEILMDPSPEIHTGVTSLNNVINPIISESFTPNPVASVNPLQIWIALATVIWLAGVAAMLIYTTISYLLLRRKVAIAVRLKNNIYQSENVDSPFVLGIINPKIYLPFRMDEQPLAHVIAHEEAHIRRKDHWWKPFGFALLALHWFNPLMWLGYILLCRDIELACDEKVIKEMDGEHKANYTEALVACSVNRRSIAACPLAFGEVGVKKRVKSVMNYKKPAFWIIIAAVIICVVVAVCFLTNPTDSYGVGIQSIRGGTYKENDRIPVIELDYFLLREDKERYEFPGKWIRQLSKQEAEFTKDGSIPYDGSLGEYRMMLEFPKTGPSASFLKNHQEGTIYTLEGVPEFFGGTIQYKVVYPNDEGMIIYIGSDVPFSFKEPAIRNGRYYFGPMQIRLYRFAEDGTETYIEPELQTDVVEAFPGGYRTYYRLRDGRWKADGKIYQYRHKLVGTLPNATQESTFVYLSNLETISFEQAWRGSGFYPNIEDCFTLEEAVLVDFAWWPGSEGEDHNSIGDENAEDILIDPTVTQRDAMIANTILQLPWDTESDAIMNTAGHIILAQETVSGTPIEGQPNGYPEELLLVHYVKERYLVVDGYQDGGLVRGTQELCDHRTGTALITLGIDDNGQYYLKEFRDLGDFDKVQKEKYAALKNLEENKTTYETFLKCFSEVSILLRYLTDSSPVNVVYGPWIKNYACDYSGDGKQDFSVTRSVEMLRALEW